MKNSPAKFIFFCLYFFGLAASICPPTGPVLPPPAIPSSLELNLTSILDTTSKDTSVEWDAKSTSFSVTITSKNSTIFTYHHTAAQKNASGTDLVTGDTIYRIASVTKVLTVLAILLEPRIRLDDPIGQYLPAFTQGQWQNVTVRMLCSQISGVQKNVGVGQKLFANLL